jgi:hypothetical protein
MLKRIFNLGFFHESITEKDFMSALKELTAVSLRFYEMSAGEGEPFRFLMDLNTLMGYDTATNRGSMDEDLEWTVSDPEERDFNSEEYYRIMREVVSELRIKNEPAQQTLREFIDYRDGWMVNGSGFGLKPFTVEVGSRAKAGSVENNVNGKGQHRQKNKKQKHSKKQKQKNANGQRKGKRKHAKRGQINFRARKIRTKDVASLSYSTDDLVKLTHAEKMYVKAFPKTDEPGKFRIVYNCDVGSYLRQSYLESFITANNSKEEVWTTLGLSEANMLKFWKTQARDTADRRKIKVSLDQEGFDKRQSLRDVSYAVRRLGEEIKTKANLKGQAAADLEHCLETELKLMRDMRLLDEKGQDRGRVKRGVMSGMKLTAWIDSVLSATQFRYTMRRVKTALEKRGLRITRTRTVSHGDDGWGVIEVGTKRVDLTQHLPVVKDVLEREFDRLGLKLNARKSTVSLDFSDYLHLFTKKQIIERNGPTAKGMTTVGLPCRSFRSLIWNKPLSLRFDDPEFYFNEMVSNVRLAVRRGLPAAIRYFYQMTTKISKAPGEVQAYMRTPTEVGGFGGGTSGFTTVHFPSPRAPEAIKSQTIAPLAFVKASRREIITDYLQSRIGARFAFGSVTFTQRRESKYFTKHKFVFKCTTQQRKEINNLLSFSVTDRPPSNTVGTKRELQELTRDRVPLGSQLGKLIGRPADYVPTAWERRLLLDYTIRAQWRGAIPPALARHGLYSNYGIQQKITKGIKALRSKENLVAAGLNFAFFNEASKDIWEWIVLRAVHLKWRTLPWVEIAAAHLNKMQKRHLWITFNTELLYAG